jgi:glycosyltransferase involved in cell wall biosynthesis
MAGAPPEPGAAAPSTPAQGRPRVLLICADPVGEQMAGLGIRCWELARVLSGVASVTLAHGGSEEGEREGVRLLAFCPHSPRPLRGLIAASDAVIAHPQWPLVDRWLRRSRARVIIDLYCPETLETLELWAGRGQFERRQRTATTQDRLHAALRTGHHFMCASETQRDLWIGAMSALRLIDPAAYDRDPSLRSTIDVVPFGVPDTAPPAAGGEGPRESVPGLGEDTEIVLWNGGIWRWLDAETAIRAVVELAERRPSVRLVFMGGGSQHPAAREAGEAAQALARSLGALGSTVHFHSSWVPYAERSGWLAQADCALSCHRDHLETRFAFRTRMLDCFWAGVPVVCTEGDDLADYVSRRGLGEACPPESVAVVSAALERVLDRGRASYADALATAAAEHSWPVVARPLLRWIEHPTPRPRLGEAPGAVGIPFAQRLRERAYLLGGSRALAWRERAEARRQGR